jgi:hypothetical protein
VTTSVHPPGETFTFLGAELSFLPGLPAWAGLPGPERRLARKSADGSLYLVKSFEVDVARGDPRTHSLHLERWFREVGQLVARLAPEDAAQVVPVSGAMLHLGRLLVWRPFFEGASTLKPQGPLAEASWQHLEAAAHLLDAAHTGGLFHGHVRPENLLLCRDGRLRLVDLGVSRSVAPLSRAAQWVLTPGFFPPRDRARLEAGEPLDAPDRRGDLHGLALSYAYLRTGTASFEGPGLNDDERGVLRSEWPTCKELIRQLRRASGRQPTPRPPGAGAAPELGRIATEIAAWRACGQRVLDNLDELAGAGMAEHARTIETGRRLASEMIKMTDSPVRVGVVGAFSAGKSLLLGTLLGNAELLPVQSRPTTGNITALHIRAERGPEGARVVERAVEWMDRETAMGCLRALLAVVAERSAGLPDIDRAGLDELARGAATGYFAAWPALEAWCGNSWAKCGDPPNPLFRYVLREMAWFGRCCASPLGQQLFAQQRGPSVVPGDVDINEALELPRAFEVALTSFEALPAGPETGLPEKLTPGFLRQAFPLVRRVRLEVRVPAALWALSGPDGTPFLLLDFPGLGAAQSGVRDQFLCTQELADVQTILVVLNANSLGGTAGPDLFNRLQGSRPPGQSLRDNILVAINRFDQLSCPVASPEKAAQLQGPDLPPELPELHAAWADASSLTTHAGRVCLVSAMAAVDQLSARWDGVCSDAFYQRVRDELRRWEEDYRDAWRRVAGRLASFPGEKGPAVADQLHALVSDGGLGRLRSILVEHVAEHGMYQLLERVRQQGAQLRRSYSELPLGRERDEGAPSIPELKESLLRLRTIYSQILLEQGEKALRLTVDRKEIFHQVARLVEEAVWRWDEWREMLGKLEQGRLPLTSPVGAEFGGFEDEGLSAEAHPEDTLHFFNHFKSSLESCWTATQGLLKEAIGEYLKGLKSRLQEEMPERDLAALFRAAKQQRGAALDPNSQRRLNNLILTVDPEADGVRAVFKPALDALASDPIPPESCYPLAGKNGDNYPQKLQWSAAGHNPETRIDHVLILRLRNQLVLGTRDPIRQRVQQFNHQLAGLVKQLCVHCMGVIERASEDHELLRVIVGPGGERRGKKVEEVRWPAAS